MESTNHYFRPLGLIILFCLFPVWVLAQTVSVTGMVKDASGEPIIGASVVEAGTTNGIVTDLDGNFKLNVSAKGSLKISFIGYQTQTIPVAGKKQFDITLKEDAKVLDEVVVVGYGQMKRSDLTGSVVSVNDEAIKKSVVTSVDQVLQGRAAGVQVQANSGMPGGSSSIRIRGINSLNASNEPIFVIDGVIIDGSTGSGSDNALASINPSDIVSMDVLKDASATAIYGARAANGVIMITTKRGQKGEAQITYDGYIGWQEMPKKLDMLNLREYAEHKNVRSGKDYSGNDWGIVNKDNNFVRPDLLGEGTDWQDEMFSKAMMTSHNLSVTGGTDKSNYALGAGYLNQDGIAVGSGFRRLNLRGSFDAQVKSYLKMGINFAFSNSRQKLTVSDESLIRTALLQSPSVAVRNAEGTFDGPDTDEWVQTNPVGLAMIKDNRNEKMGIRANTYAEATIIDGLTFKTELSFDYGVTNTYKFDPSYTFGAIENTDRQGTFSKSYNKFWSWRNIVNYMKTFGVHNVNAMIGQEMQESKWEYLMGSRMGYLSNAATDLTLGDAATAKNNGNSGESSILSYFGRLFYSYDDKYLLTFTLRRDGSSKFYKDNRWGWFPSFSAGWKLNEESFLSSVKWISLLKLRASWGKSGNDRIGYYDYLSVLTTDNSAYGNTLQAGMAPKNLKNEDLKWESTASLDFGLDFSAFNNRLQFNFDYYINKTDNLLFNLPIVMTSGYDRIRTNLGSIQNKGWELDITSHNLTGTFKWSTSLNLSGNQNKVLDMGGIDSFTDSMWDGKFITRVGGPVSQFYCYRTNGILTADDFEKKADGTPDENKPLVPVYKGQRIGNVKMVDQPTKMVDGKLVGDGVITEDDLVPYGNNIPDVIYGITNRFSYKNFELSVLIQGQIGGDVMFLGQRSLDYGSPGVNQFSHWVRCWKPDYQAVYGDRGDPTPYYLGVDMSWDGTTPNIYNRNSTYENNSDLRIYDTTYLRIKNITLSYTLPNDLLKKSFLKKAKVYVSLDNVATFDNYPGVSPETNSYGNSTTRAGVDYSTYPMSRKYTLGVNLVF